MKIVIDCASNGVIATTICNGDKRVEVFETEDPDGNDNYKGRAAVLWHLIDQLGWYGSKHDEKRVRVDIETSDDQGE